MAGGRRAGRGVEPAASTAPPARRLGRARLGDLRLWLGVGLLVASMVVGARVMSTDADTVTVWRASRDLAAGSAALDLVPVSVPRAVVGERYARAGEVVAGELRWPILAGELLPTAAVSTAASAPTRLVTLAVDPLHAPIGLLPGDVVDVWATASDGAVESSAAVPTEVLTAVTVAGAATDEVGLSGAVGIVLEVPIEDVGVIVAAGRAGVIDLVAVPPAAQGPTP